jgi:DNA-directed RNA polymerase subunit H
MTDVKILQHHLVPEHQIVKKEEEEEILRKIKASKDELPKIRKSDPVIRVLEAAYGTIEEGRLIRVLRESETAGISVAYRVVVRG